MNRIYMIFYPHHPIYKKGNSKTFEQMTPPKYERMAKKSRDFTSRVMDLFPDR